MNQVRAAYDVLCRWTVDAHPIVVEARDLLAAALAEEDVAVLRREVAELRCDVERLRVMVVMRRP